MKKLIAIGIAVLMILGISALSYAQTDPVETTKNIAVTLGVESTFGMQIWTTEYTQDLGTVVAGLGATGDLHIYASSNHVVPWTVSASCPGLVGALASPDTIPVLMSTYDATATLTGTFVTDLALTGLAQPIYTCGLGEYPCVGLLINGIFSATSQQDTKQDTYSGTIVLTMAE